MRSAAPVAWVNRGAARGPGAVAISEPRVRGGRGLGAVTRLWWRSNTQRCDAERRGGLGDGCGGDGWSRLGGKREPGGGCHLQGKHPGELHREPGGAGAPREPEKRVRGPGGPGSDRGEIHR